MGCWCHSSFNNVKVHFAHFIFIKISNILCRSYPFFRAPDDMTALAEHMTLCETMQVQTAAKRNDRRLTFSHMKECDLTSVSSSVLEEKNLHLPLSQRKVSVC